jgi:adenine/guanine phosphoribosyltransferase-like PRPP-binding protein
VVRECCSVEKRVIRVNIAQFESDAGPIEIDLETIAGSPPAGTALYVPVPHWVNPREIDRHVSRLDERYLQSADLAVFRIHPTEWSAFLASTAPEDLASRLSSATVLGLTWNEDFELHVLSDEGGAPPSIDDLVPLLREAECRALIERSGVALPPDETYHYEGPNGRHYKSFVRVGTAIQSVDSLDGLAFWLLPHLAMADVVVLDSWTILSLGLNAERYWRATSAALGREPVNAPLTIECRRRYGEPAAELTRRLNTLAARAENRLSVVIIMSVASTGQTAAALKEGCENAKLATIDVVNLFCGRQAGTKAFCTLSQITDHYAPADCPDCAEGSRTVRILPETYLMELSATVRDDVAIRLPHARQAIEFFERYGGANVVSIHRDQEGGDRHHMIYLDIGVLLEHDEFKSRLDEELKDVTGVDVVVCPEHEAGRALARAVAERLSVDFVAADPERMLDLAAYERGKLEGRRRVLVVDDIVMTGTRLRRYRNMLHRAGFALADGFELHYLAGVVRPDDLGGLRGVVDYTHFAERFHYVELLVLPNWDRDECPWCLEAQLLETHSRAVAEHVSMHTRHTMLDRTDEGLRSALFMRWFADHGPAFDPFLLGQDSIFSAQDEPELFACVASAVQVLRNTGDLNERFTLPVAKVLAQSFTFSGRFYDTVITACLLRAARRHDLRATTSDPGLEKEVRSRLREAPVTGGHGELLFALQRQHLPGQALPEVRHALEDAGGEAGLRELLRSALGR